MEPKETFTRRNLPHWYVPGTIHFVTYRLAGTIPQEVLRSLRRARKRSLEPRPGGRGIGKETAHKQFFAKYDQYLDSQSPVRYLADDRIADMVKENIFHHNSAKYYVLAYCIMPNHVHIVLQPMDIPAHGRDGFFSDEVPDSGSPISSIMHSLKSYTAHEANKILVRSGQFWQHESYDHWVRSDEELQRIVDYMSWNPVKAGLTAECHEYQYCSAKDRYLMDGRKIGLLLYPR